MVHIDDLNRKVTGQGNILSNYLQSI